MEVDYTTEDERQLNLIVRHFPFLVDRIDPDFGLLDVMIARKDLTMAQYHQIRSMPSTIEERNQKLLNYIIDQRKADRLIAALRDGRQMHLANYLISDGEYQDTFHGVWPMTENELEKLILNRQALIDGLDASYLSSILYSKDVINKRQQESILCKPTNSEKNEVMLEILRHGSIDHYKQTIKALKELNHDRILRVLGEYEEETVPEKYESDPVLVQTIKTEVKITGLTILDAELFVVSDECSEVEVYDSIKFSFSHRWKLKELIDPWDIGSCSINKCLYIIDLKRRRKPREILKVDPNGKLIRKWSTGVDCGSGLSVTDESNVLLAVKNEDKLNEYSPDGQLVREINLSDVGIIYPHHAIKLANGHFLVTNGNGALLGVCIVDADRNLKKSFYGNCRSTIGMGRPSYLAVDENGFVMVVDGTKSRVLLLDLELQFKRELLSSKNSQFRVYPGKILLDQTTNQLLVVDYQDIKIFSLSS